MQVAGYFQGVMGTGEHARQLVAALRSQGVRVSMTTLHPEASPEDAELRVDGEQAPSGPRRYEEFNLLCANADSVPGVARGLGPEFFRGRYTIGFWAWEVSRFPRRFLPAFDHVDEVWVGSSHVRDAVGAIAPVPVLSVPQPISLPDSATQAEPPAGLPEGFRFLFAFDYLSVFERKNPLAAVEAFGRAFEPGSGAALIVKSLNHDHAAEAHGRLRRAAAEHPDVHLIERRLTMAERDGLMSGADCYVSLHRAEGFGYTLAEAMWLGKPVIATGYSGNLDFMTPRNSYLVDYRLIPIGLGQDPYPPDGSWAEPNVEQAAELMQHVFQDREEREQRAARAAADIRATHGLQAAGRALIDRLDVLTTIQAHTASRRSGGLRAHAGQPAAPGLDELIRGGPRRPRRRRFGLPQRWARHALLRVTKPITVHQRMVNEQLLREVRRLDLRVQALGDPRDPEPGVRTDRDGE